MSEFKNGDAIRIHHWRSGVYVGKNPVTGADSHHIVICDERIMSIPDIAIKPEAKKETRVKGLVDLMKTLVDGGWEADGSGNFWNKSKKETFAAQMWYFCGKVPNPNWVWEPEWLEEVEV